MSIVRGLDPRLGSVDRPLREGGLTRRNDFVGARWSTEKSSVVGRWNLDETNGCTINVTDLQIRGGGLITTLELAPLR